MEKPELHKIEIHHPSDINPARRTAKEIALSIGFDEKTSEEIMLAVSELASNVSKHAYNGRILIIPVHENEHDGIQIESIDNGPGIPDVDEAIADGFSTTGSLGYGLGTVNRMMDEFKIISERGPKSGTHVICKRWLRKEKTIIKSGQFDLGAATRPHPNMTVNGDAYVIKRWEDNALAAVIDGLGHGQFAHLASQKACQYIESHYYLPLEELFRGVERSCRATRGVVMAIAKFDWIQKRLTYASIGNIEAKIFGSNNYMNFIIRRGILGARAVRPHVTEHVWETHYIMVLYSDGIKSHWSWDDFSEYMKEPATSLAQRLLRSLARDNDDATVVVVKGRSE